MKILGIETSCDETSASVIEGDGKKQKVKLLSNEISSSLPLHSKTGGIIPEVAAREQLKFILPVIENALKVVKNPQKEIDAIAVTVGPGLIGSLLIGVETARIFSYIWKKPLIPVNHLFGHIYANMIDQGDEREIEFPAVSLVVSGGHTDLVLMKDHKKTIWLGGTRDDAAGEAFDKTGRLLGLPYPGGPYIEKMAEGEKRDYYNFPRPLINSNDFDFSFSGLKTAVLREVENIGRENLSNELIKRISYSLQKAIFEVIAKKTIKALKQFNAKSLLLGGGVSANQTLRIYLENSISENNLRTPLFIPKKELCTDNGAMIAANAFFNYKKLSWDKISPDPELYFD
jgi:N6-L-threonylcarbamoyladenine synthase